MWETNHSPDKLSSILIAPSGQIWLHTPQPSQEIGSTTKFCTALKRHTCSHFPHSLHLSLSITAFFPPLKSCLSKTSGWRRRCKSAASTSQSAITLFLAKAAKEAAITVFPVPPLPLITTICFIFAYHSLSLLTFSNATKILKLFSSVYNLFK
ncbi:hypothetical protein ES707_19333 [subsurface metagenome]